MDMNLVISWGLAAMGVIAVVGWIVISVRTGTSSGTEVPISIISGLVGVLTGKNLAQMEKSKAGEALGKAAATATEVKKAVEAAENIKDIVKK